MVSWYCWRLSASDILSILHRKTILPMLVFKVLRNKLRNLHWALIVNRTFVMHVVHSNILLYKVFFPLLVGMSIEQTSKPWVNMSKPSNFEAHLFYTVSLWLLSKQCLKIGMSVEQTMHYTYYRANQSIFITNEQTMFEIGMSVEQTMYYTC